MQSFSLKSLTNLRLDPAAPGLLSGKEFRKQGGSFCPSSPNRRASLINFSWSSHSAHNSQNYADQWTLHTFAILIFVFMGAQTGNQNAAALTCVPAHVIPLPFCIRDRTERGRCCDPQLWLFSSCWHTLGTPWQMAPLQSELRNHWQMLYVLCSRTEQEPFVHQGTNLKRVVLLIPSTQARWSCL